MKQAWFKRAGWLYLPIHAMGLIISLGALAFLVPVSLAVLRTAHSVSDQLYTIFIYATCTFFWWNWIARKTAI
jgi:hypothetical protein